MKKFLKRIAAFLLTFLLVYVLAIAFLALLKTNYIPNIKRTTGGYGNMLTRLRSADTTRNIDVMILGSSHAYRGFDTRVFEANGFRTFNLGSSMQTPIQSSLLFEEYYDKMKPRILIMEVFPSTFTNDGTEPATDILSNHKIDYYGLKHALAVRNITVANTFLYQFFRQKYVPLESLNEPQNRKSGNYVKGGFVEWPDSDSVIVDIQEDAPTVSFDFNIEQTNSFEHLLTRAKDLNIKVYLIFAPLTSGYLEQYKHEPEVIEYFKRQEVIFMNVQFIDYSYFLKDNEGDYFYDLSHLNQTGVIKFNNDLLRTLKNHGND